MSTSLQPTATDTVTPQDHRSCVVFEMPKSEAEFHARLGDEESCRAYLMRVRWPNGFICPKCSHHGGYLLKNREKWECMKCKYHCSIRAGTVMEGSKKSLSMWFAAMYYMVESKQGFSALGLMRRLGVKSYQTAWTWFHKLRELIPQDETQIYGRVEVDEFYVGGKARGEGIRGRGSPSKVMVAVAVECRGRGSGRVRMRVMKSGSEKALRGFVRDVVGPGSTVHTDANPAYDVISKDGYVHDKVTSEDDAVLERHLPRVYRVSALVKRVLNGTHMGGVAPWRLQRYLDEYAFRFERKKAPIRFMLFEDLIRAAAGKACRTYHQIAADDKEGVGGVSKAAGRARGRLPAKRGRQWWKGLDVPKGWPAPGGTGG